MSIDLEEIEGGPHKPDFRRANGAPMVTIDGKNERFSRPSGWGKDLDDENALVNWKIDTAIRGAAHDKSILARAAAVKPDDRKEKKDLREAAIQAGRGNESSDTGTALHAMSERWEDPDDDFDPPEDYRKSLEAYSEKMSAIGIESVMFEYQIVHREWRAAGTCDRLYKLTKPLITPNGDTLPAGTLCIGDLKTGKKLDFSLPAYHVQMAIYAEGELYDVEKDEFLPTPEINTNWGFLVHMPANQPGVCSILWCDLGTGNWGAYLVHEIKKWRRLWKNGTYSAPEVEPPEPQLDIEAEMVEKLGAEPVDVSTTPNEDLAVWTDSMIEFIKGRMKTIRDNPDAVKALSFAWPEGVPAPKSLSEPDHVRQVLDLLDKIEADFGLTFPENDPRVTPGVHKSDLVTSNEPPVVPVD